MVNGKRNVNGAGNRIGFELKRKPNYFALENKMNWYLINGVYYGKNKIVTLDKDQWIITYCT